MANFFFLVISSFTHKSNVMCDCAIYVVNSIHISHELLYDTSINLCHKPFQWLWLWLCTMTMNYEYVMCKIHCILIRNNLKMPPHQRIINYKHPFDVYYLHKLIFHIEIKSTFIKTLTVFMKQKKAQNR